MLEDEEQTPVTSLLPPPLLIILLLSPEDIPKTFDSKSIPLVLNTVADDDVVNFFDPLFKTSQ